MDIERYLKLLDELSVQCENKLERKIYDSHDYSSSNYNAFDDGHNEGVYSGLELFTEKLRNEIEMEDTAKTELSRVDIMRYRLLGVELTDVSGDGGFGGTVLTFSNGDRVELLHFSHKESDGRS